VDTWKGDEHAGFYGDGVFEMVNQHNESQYKSFSTLYPMTFDEALAKFQDQSVDLLHIDGLHTYEAVRHDFETWLPKLAPGALVLFHDIKVAYGEFGVWKFWAELKQKYPLSTEFRHSHGLGVIELPGSTRDGDRPWLRDGTEEKKNLLEAMTANGESLITKARNQELERLASTAQTKANKPAIEKPLNLELFFAQQGEKFSEKKKISEPVLCRENEISQIKILLNGNAARSVLWRIDPGAEASLIRIHQVWFLGKNGKKIWGLTDHSDEVGIGGSAERLNGDGFLVYSFGTDPQILLPKLQLSSGEELYEIQITIEVLKTDDYLPFLASRYHELESQSRSTLAKASAALEQKEKEAAQMQSILDAKNREIAQATKIDEKIEQIRQEMAAGREESKLVVKKLQEERASSEKQSVSLQNTLNQIRQEMAADREESKLVVQRVEEERASSEKQSVSLQNTLNQIRQEVAADREEGLKQLAATEQRAEHGNSLLGSRIDDVGQYAENIHQAIVGPGSSLIPAPFSWYAMLYKALKIKKPSWLQNNSSLPASPPRPSFWRRLERSIRKRRKRWIDSIGFDRDWYLKRYPDIAKAGIDPLNHYVSYGKLEGRKKNANDRSLIKVKAHSIPAYTDWIRLYDTLTDYERNKMKLEIKQMASPPTFSIVMPVYNPSPVWLRRAIESVCHQIYPNWELCIVDDASTNPDVIQDLKEMVAKDPRISIQIRTKNGNISAASNDALSMAQGEWVVFMDHDDELKEDALFWIARAIGTKERASIIYSDEDKIGEDGVRRDPHFKTEWNPALLLSYNYFCHLLAIRKDLVNQAGGFREGFEGAQDYDLILRCIEHIDPETILHVPRVLYHWRIHSQSSASDIRVKYGAREAGACAIADHLARKEIAAKVSSVESGYRVEFVQTQKPRVTILIPTKDQANLLRTCVDSLLSKTDYPNREILLIDNKSEASEARALLLSYQTKGMRVLKDEGPFNYSRLNNLASRAAEGDLLLLLNNDIEPMHSDWLDVMVNEISQKDVGAVGAKLLYPDGKIQHGGVITGLGGVAGHSHKNLSGRFPGYFSRLSLTQDLSAVTAACMLVRKEVFVKVGGLDQVNLSIAFNDVDLCLKIRELGWRIVWTPFARLVHHESASRGEETTPEKKSRFASEIAFMKSKWGTKLQQDPHYSPNLTLDNEQFDIAFPPRLENKWMI
jgi:GT2 family glycosyltransferase